MDKIAIFYHIYQINHWENLFEQQIISMQQSGVYDAASHIHFGINGNLPLPYNLIKVKSIKRNSNVNSEADTLADLHKFCVKNSGYKVLYIHTKGVSYPKDHPGQTSWLTYLDYFNVKRWVECVKLLNNFDCVGTDWTTKHPDENIDVPPHYSGNIWWANADYISKLDYKYLYRISSDDEDSRKIKIEERHSPEFWIGTSNPKYYNFHSTNKNKYVSTIKEEEYKNL